MEPASTDSTESQQVCTIIEMPNDIKGVGDGSGGEPVKIVVCNEVENAQ